MCGIVGYISRNDYISPEAKKHFMRYALALDTLRGADSTGIMSASYGQKVRTTKSILPGIEFVGTKTFNSYPMDTWACFGHNRAATAGQVSRANAHPFTFGDVTMIHNGTLYADGSSIKTYDKRLEVDSMQIAYALSQAAPEDAGKVLEQIDGSFAIVWMDERTDTVKVARNNSRPLHYCWNTSQTIVWFMSDADHLRAINDSFRTNPLRGGQVYSLKPYTILEFERQDIVPKVHKFRPYVRQPAKPDKTNKSTGKYKPGSGSALKEAAERWHKTGEHVVKTLVNGKKKFVPKAQAAVLDKILDLNPADFLEFVPLNEMETTPKEHLVRGEIIHKAWGNCQWTAVLRHVPQAPCRAYWKNSWTVHPVGITNKLGVEDADEDFIILCEVVTYDYEKFAKAHPEVIPEDITATKDTKQKLLPGPEQMDYPKDDLYNMMTKGCVQCREGFDLETIQDAIWVEKRNELMCYECVIEWEEAEKTRKGLH